MQKPFILCLLFLLAMFGTSYAQMGAARTVAWDIDEKLTIAADRDAIWTVLKNPEMAAKLSNGYVQSVENQGNELPFSRKTTFKDGSIRNDEVTQQEEQHRFLVYHFQDDQLPKDLKLVQVAIFTEELADGKTVLTWKGLLEGKKEAKELMMQTLKKEIDQYKIGFTNYFKGKPKSIPATKMQ